MATKKNFFVASPTEKEILCDIESYTVLSIQLKVHLSAPFIAMVLVLHGNSEHVARVSGKQLPNSVRDESSSEGWLKLGTYVYSLTWFIYKGAGKSKIGSGFLFLEGWIRIRWMGNQIRFFSGSVSGQFETGSETLLGFKRARSHDEVAWLFGAFFLSILTGWPSIIRLFLIKYFVLTVR